MDQELPEREVMVISEEIRSRLFELQDIAYRDFQAKLIPGMDSDRMIGVRTPALRKLVKEYSSCPDIGSFLEDLPHSYFDENQLHAFLVSEIKDFEECIRQTERFLPFIDNWATCDQFSPKVFKKHRTELAGYIRKWIVSEKTYTVRFAVGMLMQHFLDENFDPVYPKTVAGIHSGEYYINMMAAWYFATALAKQYEAVLPYLEERRLDPRIHQMTIRKAVESYRITPEQKIYLKQLRL